jgi:hypothetical protein
VPEVIEAPALAVLEGEPTDDLASLIHGSLLCLAPDGVLPLDFPESPDLRGDEAQGSDPFVAPGPTKTAEAAIEGVRVPRSPIRVRPRIRPGRDRPRCIRSAHFSPAATEVCKTSDCVARLGVLIVNLLRESITSSHLVAR